MDLNTFEFSIRLQVLSSEATPKSWMACFVSNCGLLPTVQAQTVAIPSFQWILIVGKPATPEKTPSGALCDEHGLLLLSSKLLLRPMSHLDPILQSIAEG